MDIFTEWIPNVIQYADQFPKAIIDTLIMLIIPGIVSVFFGLIVAVIVILTKPGGLMPNKAVFWILDKLINLFRSIPFIILIPLLMVLSRFFFHTALGVVGSMIPLTIGTIPFMARQMETAMEEIPDGIVEAGISMGMSPWQIVKTIYLRENIPGLIRGVTITLIALIGQIAIVGTIGAGGLGDLAIRYGSQRRMMDITVVVIILILIIISVIQACGDWLARKATH